MTKEERLNAEIERTRLMGEFEKEYIMYANVCGIDEAGRGPLCGPVVAGAVILPKECNILYINDSKKLTNNINSTFPQETFDAICQLQHYINPNHIQYQGYNNIYRSILRT